MKKYLKKTEIAKYFDVSTQRVDQWAREGKIKIAFRTPGGRPRYLNPEWVEPKPAEALRQGVA